MFTMNFVSLQINYSQKIADSSIMTAHLGVFILEIVILLVVVTIP